MNKLYNLFLMVGIQDLIIGSILIIYGILKILLSILVVTLNEKQRKHVPFLKHDLSVAGLMIDGILLIFGIYTILHGLAILELMPKRICDIVNSTNTIYTVYATIGFVMIFFFGLVVFTDVKIPKKPDEQLTYEIVGFGGGIGFFIALIGLMIYNCEKSLYSKELWFLISILVLLIGAFVLILIDAFRRKNLNKKKQSLRNEFITLAMLPLGTIS